MAQIDYAYLCNLYGQQRIDNVVSLLVDTVCTKEASVRIGKQDMPSKAVCARLLRLSKQDIQDTLDSMDAIQSPVKNPTAYLLTSLYNAAGTTSAKRDYTPAIRQKPRHPQRENVSYDLAAWEQDNLTQPIVYEKKEGK